MCYKTEKQKKEALRVEEKLKDMPEFIKDYFSYLNSTTTKLNNYGTIKYFLEWLINKGFINKTLINITPDDLESITDIHLIKYLDALLSGLCVNKNSLSSINTKKNVISGFWTYLIEKDYVKKNIVNKKLNDKYKTKDKEVVIPSAEDMQQLLVNVNEIKNETIALRDIAIIKLLTGSGIRLEELVGLDIGDVYLNNPKEPYVTVLGKGLQGEDEKQNVLINQSAMDAINDYLKVRSLIPNIETTNALFISEQKDRDSKEVTRISQRGIQKFFSDHSNKKIHPHLLRHYAGTKMYENSNDIVAVANQLRHSDVNTSRKYYIKNNKEAAYNALNSI